MTTPTMSEQTLDAGNKMVTARVTATIGGVTKQMETAVIVTADTHLMPVVDCSEYGVTLQLVGNPNRGTVYAAVFELDPSNIPPYDGDDADAQEADDEPGDWWDE